MKNQNIFPENVLNPIKKFLHMEEEKLTHRKKDLEKEDPFNDPRRLSDNAAPDTEAAEQFDHARVEAMKKEVDRRIIDIRKAMTRIKIGKYGVCDSCGKMIDTDRLMIKPEASLCISCEKKKEK
jgi:DnaK suppressor protein